MIVCTTIITTSDLLEINRKRSRQEETPNFINLEANEEHISKVTSPLIFCLSSVERRKST